MKEVEERFNNEQGRPFNGEELPAELLEAENILSQLASVFSLDGSAAKSDASVANALPGVTDTYRILVEQIPAVVFIAFFEKNFGEAYVSPQIEETLGFKQEEWLRDSHPLQHLSEIPQKFFERIGRAGSLGLIVAAQVGGDHPIITAEIGDLVMPLVGIAASAMDADDRPACGRLGRPNVDHAQANRPRTGDADGCAGEVHVPSGDEASR